MRTRICIFLSLFTSYSIYGQTSMDDVISQFEANCSDAVSTEEPLDEFTLLVLTTTDKETTILNFEIIANCAQKNRGSVTIDGDTLKIDNTDMSIPESRSYEILDSAGNVIEIVEETFVADIALCDCLVNFFYEFSTSLRNINHLTFHERTFKLNKTKRKR